MNETPYPASPITVDETGHEPLVPIRYIVIGVIVLLVVGVAFAALLAYLAINFADTIVIVRDIFIIALGIMSCLSGIVLILLLISIIRLINMLEFELKPILLKTNDTLGTIRGTTAFMSDNVMRPVTTASSYMAGVRRGVQTLFGDPRRNLGK
ncbi:MAG TPA: hypothetical protein PK205_10015 [Promineifilum sp.]|nr:hypothetical protein [Promineifilum sp.]HRO23443.1 hypothetical protein [Promineifilum sp.]HRO92107.1 hypothetical protein [Promineifilum sp.]HRQ13628.1 hypothetical protein [Promineifilum sp.]